MYPYEDRIRAVRLNIDLGKCGAATGVVYFIYQTNSSHLHKMLDNASCAYVEMVAVRAGLLNQTSRHFSLILREQ